jgi:hypothetical protein
MVRLHKTAEGMYETTVGENTYLIAARDGYGSGQSRYGWDVRCHSVHKWFKTLKEVRDWLDSQVLTPNLD